MARAKWLAVRHVLMLERAPKKRTIYDEAKKKPQRKFLKKKAGKLFVNVNDAEYKVWVDRIMSLRERHAQKKTKKGASPPPKPKKKAPPSPPDEMDRPDPDDPAYALALKVEGLKCEKLEEELREKRIKNQTLEIKLRRANFQVIDWDLANFLFFGYAEKLSADLVKLPAKLKMVVDNLVSENDADGIIKRFERELTSVIREIKKAQALDVRKWREENNADL